MLKKLNEAMDYIEEHLEEDFSLDEVAEYVHVSDLHLRKIFFALTNMSLNDYVKNRRMSNQGRKHDGVQDHRKRSFLFCRSQQKGTHAV